MRKLTLLISMLFLSLGMAWAQPDASPAPENGKWAEGTKWYTIKTGTGNYLRSDVLQDGSKLALTSSARTTENAGLWCFVGNEESGYTFYNRAAGPNAPLKMYGTEADAYAKLTDATNGDSSFDFTKSKKTGDYWCLKQHGSEKNYWNKRNNRLAYWNSTDAVNGWNNSGAGDDGSALLFEAVSIETFFKYADSEESIDTWYYMTINSNTKSYLHNNGTADVIVANKSAVDNNDKDAYTWAFIGNPFDGFVVKNKKAGYLNAGNDGAVIGENSQIFTVTKSSYGEGGFFMAAEGKDRFNRNGVNFKVVYWSSADAGSTFQVIEREPVAKIDDVYYWNLSEAVAAIGVGQTLTLLAETSETIVLPMGAKLDKNGFTAANVTVKQPVAIIGETMYELFADALVDAKAMTGDVTVKIYDKVTLNQALTGSYSSIKFVGEDTDAEIYIELEGYIEAAGKKVAFEDLKLSKVAGGYMANAGFMNVAFGVYGVTEATYTNCIFLNGAYASTGNVTFTGCTFKKSWDKYGLWAYGDVDVTVDGCTFADIRGIKMYDEGKAGVAALTVSNSNFSAVTDKPAIVLTYGESVVLDGNTYSSTGTFELDLDGKPNGVAVTSDVTPVCVNDNGACGVLVDGKIYTTVAQAAEVATSGSNVTLLHNSAETVEFAYGVNVDKNNFSADNVTIEQPFADYVVLPDGVNQSNYKSKFGANTVTDGVNYYATLQAAVEAVAKNAGVTRQAGSVLYCKPGADVGSLQHAPVVSTLTVYGNGANVTGGSERDFDLGNTDPSSGKDITADMTLTVKHLNGCGAWGAKATEHTVNLVFENCANMGKVFITGYTGTLNITMTDCAFEGVLPEAVYSNADGAITLNNVAFSNLNKAINLNHKAAGTQTVTIDGCSFTNCGADVAADQIPVRVLSSVEGGKSVLNVSNATFSGTPTGGADILLDYGVGVTEAAVENTSANVHYEQENNVPVKETVSAGNSYEFTTAKPVASINGTTYMTLAEAVAAAQANDEITLIADVTLAEVVTIPANKTLTIDLNGKSISMEESIIATAYAINNLGNLTITDGVGGGSINARGVYNGYGDGGANVTSATITVLGGTFNAKGTNGGAAIFNYGTANVNGGKFTSIGGYSLNNQAGAIMNIADGVEVTGGIYNNSNASLTVNGGNISNNRSGCHTIYAWNAKVTVNGGSIHNENSGNATIMSAGTSEVTINGGTISIKDGRVPGNGNTWTSCLTDAANTAKIIVNGGTFNGGVRVQDGATMTINGGSFNDVTGSKYNIYGTVTVTGGTFTDANAQLFASTYVADGYELGTDGAVAKRVVAKIGNVEYGSLSAAFAAVTDDNQTVVICKDVTENLTGAYLRGNITTENDVKVTITLTNSDWVYCVYTFVLGENVTLKVPALFYYAGGAQINGTVIADAYYQRYANTKLIINEPGSMTVKTEQFYLRYTDNDANAGIYINGDNNDETIGLNLAVAYFYQGMINAKNANIVAGTYWQTNETDGQGTANLVLDNSKLVVSVYDHPAKATGNSTVTLKNGSVIDAKNGGFTYGDNTTLSVDATSQIIGKGGELVELPVATINGKKYTSLQAAIDAVKNGETITLLADVAENVTLTEKTGLYYTIDGAGKTMKGSINVASLSDTEDNRRITIKNIKFVDTADANVDFISSVNTNHYPRLTIEGCTFTGSGNDGDVAVRLKSSHSVVIKDCTATGLHSFLQNTSGWNLTIEGVKVTDSKSAFALGTVQGVTVKGCTADVPGYGIRMDAGYNNNAVIESNTIKAFIPVVVRKASVESNITVNGTNTMTATNTDGIWFAAGTSEYETNGQMPTAATGKVKVTLNDTGLSAAGVYGNYVPVAKIGDVEYTSLEAAFAAATEDQTITLLDDATPALTSQRAITKAAVIDLGGKTMTLTEDDLYFGTTTFKNGTIVVDPSVKPSTAVFWMFANQTLTFDAVKVVATGVTGTYLIGLDGNNSDLNLLNGSEIFVENTTALDLDIICVNASTGNDIKVENSKVNVTNLDGRVFFRGNYTVKDSEVNLAGITKAGFRIEAGQTLSIEGTSKVNIEGEPRDGGIHLTDITAVYTKAETATVNATLNEPAKGSITPAYTGATSIWGEGGGNAKQSLVVKLYSNETLLATASLNNIGGIINGNVYVSWNIPLNSAGNDEYWTVEWSNPVTLTTLPTKVVMVVDGVEVAENNFQLNSPDDLNKIVAAVTDAEGKIISCHTSVANAAAVTGVTNIALLRNTEESIMIPNGVTLNTNGFTANNVTTPVARVNNVDYATLADAMAAAKAGDVVTVFAGTYAMPSMKAGITIEGKGEVVFEGTLTGTLENLTMKNIHIKGANAQRWAYAKGNLVFENVTFEATSVYALHFDGITEGANLTYKNCTIIGWAALGGSPESCVFDGCTFKGNGTYGVIRTYFDTEIKNSTFDVANVKTDDAYQDGIHAVEGANVTVENCENANGDMKAIVNVEGSSVITVDGKAYKNVAQIGETKYITIEDAIAAWTNNTTLTLLSDVTLSDVVKLKSTEHHTLDLGTYTMTAASGKNAIEITCEGRSSASYALTVNADATNPGGITATGKACIYYSKSGSTKDRPIIRIYNGVFNGSYSINSKSNGNTNCPQIWIYGGTFNGNVNLTKNMLRVFGGTFNGWINCTGDSSAYREISGGTFKSWQFMTADADNKFWVGTSKANYNVGVHVDDNGYLVVGGPVVTEPGNFEASSANYGGWSSYLKYSSAKDNGLYYTSVEEALADNNTTSGKVTVYADDIDMSGINSFKGTIVIPVGKTVTIANAPANLKVQSTDGYTITPDADGKYVSIALVAKIGDKVYDSFEKAVAAAQEGETVTVHKAGTYALKVKNNITITGAVEGVEFANIGAFGCDGANVTFNNVTFTYAENSTYKGLQHSGNLVYNNCTFNGQVFLYGQSETFNKCTFNTTDSNNYNVWTYGAKNVAFNECTFNCAGKSVLIYSEQASNTNNVTVSNSKFIATQAVDGKAAIEMDSSLSGAISLTIDGETTANGFGTGNVSGNSLWNNKKGNNDVANNDITVKVGDTVVLAPIFEAQIGDAQYRFFQDAINAVQNGETITVLRDIATNVEIKEKDNVKVTIDGNGMKMTGTIKVVALSSDNDRRITIKNFKFEDNTSASVDFITSVETNHYPRITVEGCTFTGSGDATDVALRLKSSKNVEIKNCTGKGLHSFLQNTSGWNLTIEGVTVTESKSGLALGTVQGVTVKGCTVDVPGYGIRMDAGYNNNAVLENNTVKAFIPVVVRKATVNSNIAVNGTNNLTATNEDGIWCAIGTSEYEANGAMPTAATGNVVVALNDAALDSKGIYGNALAGQGTAEAPYLINNIGELVLFRNSVNAGETKYSAPGVHVALGADIDMTGINWVGIGTATAEHGFMGNFDGKGFKIKNLTIDNPALDSDGYAYAGLFGVTEGTDKNNQNTIKNLTIENVTINTTGHIAAAAIAYPYYTIVDNVKVCGDIKIQGGDYTAGVLAYTRRCVNASNLAIVGNTGSFVKGNQVVGGVISDIQMNGGLTAVYSNFSAEGVTVSGTKNVGGISGIIATQTLNGATVKNVTLNSSNAGVGIVAGCLGGTSTISNVTYENVAGATALIGNTYDGTAIEAKIGDTYYATLDAALAAEGEATVELFVPVTVATGESRVINLNGKTVIGTDNATGSFALININPEAELTINGEGAIKLTATNNRGWNAYSSVISNQRGKLTVNGGTIEHLGGTDMAYAIDNLTNTGAQNAETVINGGTIKSTYRAIRQFLNSTSAQNVLTVNGGTIEGANKSIWMQGANANANPGALTVAAAAAIKGDVYLTSAAGTAEYPVIVAVAADALKDGAQVLTSNVPADFAVANVNGTWTKVDAAASLNGKGYATLRAAVEAAQNGETVELLANVTLAGGYEDATEGLRIEKEITLNGNGHTIDCGTFQKGIRIYNLGNDGDFQVNFNNVEVVNNVANGRCIDTRSHDINLTIIDSKLIAQNGNSQPLTIGGSEAIQRVKLDDAIIDAGNYGYGVIAFVPVKQNIYAYDDTKVTGYAAFYLKDHGNANIKLSLGKGTYIGKNIHSGASNTFGTVVLEGDNNILQIIGTNPTLKAITEGNASQAVVLVIGANNKVSLESESATIDIVGENAYYGMISAENAGTTTIINKGNTMFPVAEVGGFQFVTIKEAIRYAGNEGTVKVINDCVLKESWTIPAGKKYTLDLNGKTVSYKSAVAGEDMITNRGNLTITDSSDAKTGKLAYVNTDKTASNVTVSTISTEAGSTLVVDGGTIENKTVKADGSSIYSYAIDILTNGNLGDVNVTINGGTVYSDYMAIRQFNNGTACKNSLTINGGYIYGAKRAVQVHMDNNAAVTAIKGGKVEAGAEGYALCNFAATGNLEVTGGEFIGAVYSARENFISGGIYDAEVYAGYCAEGYMPNKNVDGTYGVVAVKDVYASIDGVTYGSLKAAVKAAKAGETITLLQDVKENVTISKNLTIDGAGKTITGMITTDGKSLKVTIKNVNFDGNNGTINYAMRADDDLNLLVQDCTASNYLYGFLYANKSNDKIVVKNVTVENCAEYGAYLVAFNSASFENFTVKGNTKYGIAVANSGARTVNLKNVTFEGAEQPLHINEIGTGKVTFNFSGSNEMSKAEFYTSQYVKVVAAAQVGTKVCGSLQDAVVAANDGETVKVLADVNMTTANFVTQVDGYATLVNVAGKAVTIDLNGKKVTVNAADADLNGKAQGNMLMSVFHADPNGTLTLTDSSAEGTGTVELFANDATVYALIVSENANDKSNPGKIIVNGGNYIADKLSDSMIFADINEVITVNGGNFHLGNVGEGPKGNGSPWIFNASGNNQMHINVNGGTYNANVAKQHWTYEVKLGEGLTTTNNGDGTWTVVPAVATVGEESFGSIQEAIDAAQNGETVKLIADVALDTKKYTTQVDNLVVLFNVKGKAVTFDLNGKKIDVNASAANLGGKMLAGVFSADVEGDFTITDSSAEGTGAVNVAVNDAKVYSVFISENAGDKTKSGKMTVEAGNFTTVGKVANAMIYADTDKVVTINGGTFICDGVSASENYPWFVNTLGNNEMQVTVNGGTFNIDINHQYRPFEVFVPENLAVKANGNGTWTIVPAQAYVTEMLGAWVTEPGDNEHKVGYATVAEAFAAVKNGETVTILAGEYTQNLNVNKAITVKGEVDAEGNNLVTFNGKLSITADGATVENLNFNNSGTAAYVGAKNVTIDGCSLVGSNGLYQSYTSGLVTFKNSYIKGGTYGIHFDGNAGGNIVIENCTVIGWTSFAGTIENVAISGTTFAEGNYNQLRFYQNATITDCTFNEKMNIDWGSSNKTGEFNNCSVEGDKELIEILSLSNIATKGLEVTIDGERVCVAAKVNDKYYLSLQSAIDAATVGQTVTIVSDIALTEGVTVAADDEIFIDLNGKTVSMETAEAAVAALIKNNGTLTIESSVDGGKLSFLATAPSAANAYASNTISNYGTLTINGGTVENLSAGGACYALDNYAGSTATINGGKLTAEKTAVRVFNWTNGEANAAELNVVGGEIISNDGYGININAGNAPYVALNISGGTITTNDTDYNLAVYVVNKNSAENFTANISGGTFNGNLALNGVTSTTMAKGNVSVSGGTFDGVICYGEPACQFITGGSYMTEFTEDYLVYGYQLTGDAAPYEAKWTGRREVVTIVDGEVTEFDNENDIEVGTLTYKRKFAAVNVWQPLYVPFEIPVSKLIELGYDVAYTNDVHLDDNEFDGVIDRIWVEYVGLKHGKMKANFPYVVRAKNTAAKELTLVFNDAMLRSTSEDNQTVLECSSAFYEFEFGGTYNIVNRNDIRESEETSCFALVVSNGNWAEFINDALTLSPFRVYMTMTAKDGSAVTISENAMKNIGSRLIGEENEDGTTTIYDVNAEDGEDATFDLSGRRVLETEKGRIYIKNGKKVYVK